MSGPYPINRVRRATINAASGVAGLDANGDLLVGRRSVPTPVRFARHGEANPIYVRHFNALGGELSATNSATLALDDDCMTSAGTAYKSIKLTHSPSNSYSGLHCTFAEPKNWMAAADPTVCNYHVEVNVKALLGTGEASWRDNQTRAYFKIFFNDTNNFLQMPLIEAYVPGSGFPSSYRDWEGAWQKVTSAMGPSGSNIIITGTADWEHVIGFEVTMRDYINAGRLQSILVDSVVVYPKPAKAKICITTDDGHSEDGQALAYLRYKGLRGTAFVNPGYVGQTIGQNVYLTWQQLRDHAAQGHLIANHSWDHPANWTVLTETQAIDEQIVPAIAAMVDEGLGRGADVFAVPTWMWTPAAQKMLVGRYLSTCRIGSDANGGGLNFPNRYEMLRESGATTADVDHAIAFGGTLVPVFHGITAGMITLADYVATKYAAGDVDVVTMDELLTG